MDKKPKLRDLAKALMNLTWSEVVNLVVQLNVPFSTLKKIEEDNAAGTRLLAALDAWLKSDRKASWKKVVKVLKDLDLKVLAQEIEEKCKELAEAGSESKEEENGACSPVAVALTPPPPQCATDPLRSTGRSGNRTRVNMGISICGGDGATEDQATDHDFSQQLTVQCQQKNRAPHWMVRGSATTDSQFAYFAPIDSTSLYQYEYSTEKWLDLPPCPYRDSGLAIIDSELTTVGGKDDRYHPTNKLFTLRQRKWVKKYPPMNTACSDPAVVSTSDGEYLILIGGYDGVRWTATVELFQVKNRRWHKLTDLPQPLSRPSATICGDQLNVIRENGDGYSCSLQALPSSETPITSPLTLSWIPLPRLSVIDSTAAILCGQLVSFGGWQDGSSINSIHQLVDGEWVRIGSMSSCRYLCLVASPSPDRIIIVGGYDVFSVGDSVEECAVV